MIFPILQAGCVTSLQGIFLFYRWYSKRSSRIPALDGIYCDFYFMPHRFLTMQYEVRAKKTQDDAFGEP